MKIIQISIAVLFFSGIATMSAQEIPKKDTVKTEKAIDGVIIQGNTSKKTEAAVLTELKKSVVQKQAVSAEEISRKGISNVEQGLTKVTGITTVQGKGIFVRGLEERYNTLLINGLGSPSNNPFQKIIALKQFPTDVVGKLNIYKTFNSNLYADFAGATFDIETLTLDKPFTKIEFSVGVNSVSTFRNHFKVASGANTLDGYVGLNSRDRQLPTEVDGYKPTSYSFSKEQSLHSFKDSWNVDNVKSLPNTSIGFTTLQKFKTGESGNIGLLLSINHGQSFEYKNGAKNLFFQNGNEANYNNLLNRKEYSYNLESSVLLGLGYKNKGTNINFNGIFLQNSENLIQDYRGYKDAGQSLINGFFRVNQQDISRFVDLQLSASQKIGDRHLFKAGGSWVINSFQQPDRKIFFGEQTANSNEVLISYGGNNLIRQYLDVNGKNYFSAYGEYSAFLGDKGDRKDYPWQVTLGYNGFADIRNTSYRFIFSRHTGSTSSNIVNIDTPQVSIDNAIKSDMFYYNEGSTADYRNNLYQFVNAGYLTLNFKPTDSWDILVGGRVENNMNITRYKEVGMAQTDGMLDLARNQTYILPSLSIKNALNTKSNIRFSASKTITRPILIEYMPILYINPDNENIVGNSGLQNSENYNLDLKYEIFPTNKEMLAVNLFAKKLDKAIERSYISSGNSNGTAITFYNAKSATVAGVELEGILGLGRFLESLDRLTLGANSTFMYSDVKRSEEQKGETDAEANRNRKLQGAAPWIINADLKYEYKNTAGFTKTLSLVYNVSGKKIYGVGFSKLDNVYELPFHQLDVVYNNQLDKNWNIKLSAQNILNSEYKLELGDRSLVNVIAPSLLMENYKKGTTFNVSVGYTF